MSMHPRVGGLQAILFRSLPLSGSTARLQAISAVTNYKPISAPLNFAETPTHELFGSNVFGMATMERCLPKHIFKIGQEDHREGGQARRRPWPTSWPSAMKRLGHRQRGHALRPRLLSPHRPDRRKARQLFGSGRQRRSGHRILRQGIDPRRTRRVELPLGRHPRHVRSPRLHRLGRDQPGLHSGKPQRHDALHSHGLRLVDRRSARQEDAGAAIDAGPEQAGPAHLEVVRPRRSERWSRRRPAPSRNTS